jgi:hypothetical protein
MLSNGSQGSKPMKIAVVVTTIDLQAPAIPVLSQQCKQLGWELVIVGDLKTKGTPPEYGIYLGPDQQLALGYKLTELLPWNNYARKNIGYIYAYKFLGADRIISTDDDNIPLKNWGEMPQHAVCNYFCNPIVPRNGKFINVMSCFSPEPNIYPRGLPFESIIEGQPKPLVPNADIQRTNIGIVAGLWNGSPDFDAIGHAIWQRDFKFAEDTCAVLAPGVLAPYNTQNTLIIRELLPYQYLAHNIGRANDIWASYISQFIMNNLGYSVKFVSPTVYQQRNKHTFSQDFQDELLCYTKTTDLVGALEKVKISDDPIQYYIDLCTVAGSYISGDGSFLRNIKAWLIDLGVYHE